MSRLLRHSSVSTSHGTSDTIPTMLTCKPACTCHAVGISTMQTKLEAASRPRYARTFMSVAHTSMLQQSSGVCLLPLQKPILSSRTLLTSTHASSEAHISASVTATEPISDPATAAANGVSAVPITLAALLQTAPPTNVLDTWRMFLRTIHQLGHFPSAATDM